MKEAQSLAERGLALSQSDPDSLWVWTFRLLRAEALIGQLDVNQARAALAQPLPGGAEFDTLRTRQRYLQAMSYVAEGRLPDAMSALDLRLRRLTGVAAGPGHHGHLMRHPTIMAQRSFTRRSFAASQPHSRILF